MSTARGGLTICAVAKMVYPRRASEHTQDMATYHALRPNVSRVYLVVVSAGDGVTLSHSGNVLAVHLPYGASRLGRYIGFAVRAFVVGRKLLARRRVDVLMAPEPLSGGVVALVLGRLARVPVLVHVQGDLFALPSAFFSRPQIALARWLTVQVSRRAHRVRCISRTIHDLCRAHGIDEARLRILPIRCDFRSFDPERWLGGRIEVRRRFGIPAGAPLVTSSGALTVHKGHRVLIEAVAQLMRSHPGTHLLIVGEGPLRNDLEALGAARGIAAAVHMPGWIPYDDLPAILAATDVYAQPSFDEGVPRSVLEAMAMARPVVASRVGGIPELVDHDRTGLLVPVGDAGALASAMAALLDDEAGAKRMGAAARNAVRAEYGFDEGIDRYAALLVETAGAPPAS